jgi:sec-independent protein translocase protein TatA
LGQFPTTVFLIFDISGGELLVVLLFILMFFGSKGIPDIARTMGRTMRQLRDATNEVQREIQKGASDVKQGFEAQRRDLKLDQFMEPPAGSVAQPAAPVVKPTAEAAAPAAPGPAEEEGPKAP